MHEGQPVTIIPLTDELQLKRCDGDCSRSQRWAGHDESGFSLTQWHNGSHINSDTYQTGIADHGGIFEGACTANLRNNNDGKDAWCCRVKNEALIVEEDAH